jgi:RNA polymerase sigma-70 factor (sigma-E family)
MNQRCLRTVNRNVPHRSDRQSDASPGHGRRRVAHVQHQAIAGRRRGVRTKLAPMPEVAFAKVYERDYLALVRLAHLLTASNEVGEDIVQESFARALDRWEQLDNPAAYLRTTVVNRSRSWHRHRAVEERLGRRITPDGEVAAEHRGELWDALATLPFRQRAALVLRFYEDRTTDEIAALLGCRPGTARSLLSRGIAALREVIER